MSGGHVVTIAHGEDGTEEKLNLSEALIFKSETESEDILQKTDRNSETMLPTVLYTILEDKKLKRQPDNLTEFCHKKIRKSEDTVEVKTTSQSPGNSEQEMPGAQGCINNSGKPTPGDPLPGLVASTEPCAQP